MRLDLLFSQISRWWTPIEAAGILALVGTAGRIAAGLLLRYLSRWARRRSLGTAALLFGR
ncbi:MAG: hypothetical protein HY900_20030 [Deltaproteobacteria bacterium]|nr:hypothetical protein [Deltaproteobacteria bacterium]